MATTHSSGQVAFDIQPDDSKQLAQPQYQATASYVPYSASAPVAAPWGADQPRKSCCRSFFSSLFDGQCWFFVLFNLVFMFAFGMFASCWSITTFCFSLGFFIVFPVGPVFFMLSVISWRWLGKLELMMQLYISGHVRSARTYGFDAMCAGPVHEAVRQNMCSCNGFWTAFKLIVFEKDAWTTLGYLMFVKLPSIIFNFVWTALWVVLPLCLIFNFAVIAGCDVCYQNRDDQDWGRFEQVKWIVSTYKGSSVTVPVGLVLLCFGLTTIRSLTLATARLAVHCLASGVQADHSPLIDGRPSSNY